MTVDDPDLADPAKPTTRRANFWQVLRRLVAAVRDADNDEIERTLQEVGGRRKWLAPIGFVVMLWQSAYAELVFLDTLWPDFTRLKQPGEGERYVETARALFDLGDE